jgi:Tol biopolymer transport system component
MTDQELERRLRAWYRSEIPADETAPAALRSSLTAIPKASPAPWRRFGSRRGLTLLAAAALLTSSIVGGALIAGSNHDDSPSVVPTPDATSTSTRPSSKVPTEPPASGLVAYRKYVPFESVSGCTPGGASWFGSSTRPDGCYRLWVSNADGAGAHELLPDQSGHQSPVTWSPDGTRLLFEGSFGDYLIDPSGSVLEELPFDSMCVYPCADIEGYAFSPDGTQLAFVMNSPDAGNSSVIATMDLATRQITKLASTEMAGGDGTGRNGGPRWSPDGTRLIFGRQADGPAHEATLFVANVDGSDLHELGPTEMYLSDAQWSPDGSLIAFLSVVWSADGASDDVYVIRPDGTDLRRLTTDGISIGPHWTADGRLVFARIPGMGSPAGATGYEAWIMDADGGNLTELPVGNLAQLSAANCLVCPYLPDPAFPFIDNAVWQPVP